MHWRASWWGWKIRVQKLAWNWTFKKLRWWHPVSSLHGKQKGKKWKQWQSLFSWAPKALQIVTAAMKFFKRHLPLEGKAMTNLDRVLKKQRHHFANKGPCSQSYDFSSSHIWMWGLDHKEGWVPKNWCFWIVVLEKTLESPLDCMEIRPLNFKGSQLWIFIGRTEAETPVLWPPDVNSWLIGKDPDDGKDRRQEKGTPEDQMVRRASPTQRTWIWANSGRWWRTEEPGVLQSMGSQRVGCDLVTEQGSQHKKDLYIKVKSLFIIFH